MKQMKKTNVVEVEELNVEETKEVKKTTYESVDSFDNIEFDADGFGESQYADVYFVKLRTKEKCYFELSKKVGDKFITEERTDRNVLSGELLKIETGYYTYDNREIKTLKFHLVRENADKQKILFILSTSYTQSARTLVNCLLNINEPIKRISISTYKNAAGYSQISVSVNSKMAKWKYEQSFLKTKIEDIKNRKNEIISKDYSELDDFLEHELLKMLKIWFPNQHSITFVDEEDDNIEETFGEISDDEDDTTEFFEINENR